MTSMPSSPMSSTRPMKGLTRKAPALATSIAWRGWKQRAMLTLSPLSEQALQAWRPAIVLGSFTAMAGAGDSRVLEHGLQLAAHDLSGRVPGERFQAADLVGGFVAGQVLAAPADQVGGVEGLAVADLDEGDGELAAHGVVPADDSRGL